ncbi:MAG: hypothetical protein GY711_26870 [bacterium]|nr:hypothetical protein [bacterium]
MPEPPSPTSAPTPPVPADGDLTLARRWAPRLDELARHVRRAARRAMREALERGRLESVSRPVGEGAGDVTFGLDVACEDAIGEWLLAVARKEPLSLLTEDTGWRHLGPAENAGPGEEPVELAGFDHGGPRIAVDPVDGTRGLMNDLRAAWTVVSFCGPGPEVPRLADVTLGLVAEIPDSRAAHYRTLTGLRGGGCTVRVRNLGDDLVLSEGALFADTDDRVDDGFFPFFAFHPDIRAETAALAARFFRRVEEEEDGDTSRCFDDQFISSGGQLVLTALGTYRMVVEARHLIATRRGRATQTCKPYDMAGAALCAREAGCVVTALDGRPLDFPLDTETPVTFVAFANEGTGARLWPHLAAVLEE